nr:PAS domain S-box protein [Candidatus Dependentiae bacterium]
HLFCFMDTTDIDNAKNNLKRREKGIKEQHDFNFIKKDGTKINAHLETSPLYDDFGNYIGAIAGVIDITYRKQTEEQLLKHEKELQIKNELLIQINSRLKEKEKILIKRQLEIIKNAKMASLGQLVAGIAHEINNPNNFLSINIPVLKQYWEALKPILIDSLNKQPEKKLGKVSYTKITNEIEILIDELQDGSDRIKKIVSSLKDFSQQSVNYFKLISINIAIEKSLTIVKSGISKKTKNIILNLQNDLPSIKGDETKIMQVIINLLNNAADAINKKNDGYVKIETKLVEKNLVISISDNGCGIEADKMKYLMEPFYTTKAESGGTGLGMPIVYGIVKEHNAELCVLSSLNWGTKIIILIPYGEINPVINSEILLFESDESITKKYTLNFTDSGLNIISFCNFDFLLNYLYSENIINTIILNIETLSEDSIDFIIKYKNRNPWVKIILISEKEIIGHILLEYSFKNRIFSKISESLTELIFMIKDYML